MFDSISNVNDYLSEHWLAEVFPSKLKDLGKDWKERASQGKETPVKGLAAVSSDYLRALGELPDPTHPDYTAVVTEAHSDLLRAVGFEPGETVLETFQGETPIAVPLLARVPGVGDIDALHILQAVPATDADSLFADDAELLHPLQLTITSEKTEELASVSKAITQLFVSEHAPRYLLVLAGGTVLLTDAARWSEGRYLAFDVAIALDRRDEKAAGELAHHAGLWSADVLLPNDDGKATLDAFSEDSEKHAVGVSEDLREGLRISIEKIANEVLAQRRAAGLPVEGIPELPRDLTTQSLRFLYRILFLLFAEARPELGILPVGAPEYGSGYGLDRLREIIQVPLTGRSADGHHLHESLNLLFRLVNEGYGTDTEDRDGLVFEPMRSDLFKPAHTPLIDDARISNRVLQEVLTLLLLSKPSKNKNKQRGYISYAQLGINQLGAVYEGLMSYTGLIADDDMVEVAKDGNADKGSWLVPSSRSGDYDGEDIVWREDRLTGRKDIVRHPKGSFVFRLSGRDRQRSASYYTPEVLTKTVVKHALAELITDETTAPDILEYRICEPALGSGAFLNEAINQLAAEYLARRQNELGERIDPEQYTTELQKVKAYIALHRAYGVDLNATAVELAEVSLWLNVMHRGLQAPWFGLHLRRGNSLIGARRATYDFTALGKAKKSWLTTPPTDRPLSEGPIGDGEIHHFLLPASGWAAVADAKQAKELMPKEAAALRAWRKEVTKKPDKKQLDRLRALSRRVERLWELTLRRLAISEREVSRQIDVWGAELPIIETAVPREQVESELRDPEGPYMRLKLAMDAWCAMWFWPLKGSAEDSIDCRNIHPAPPSLDEWILTLEELLGFDGVRRGHEDQAMFHETVDSFGQLAEIDDLERNFYGMSPVWKLVTKHGWLGIVHAIAEEQSFFHWELDFAQILRRGGFDLQLGNPPWVRPVWKEDAILAEFDPYFILEEKIPEFEFSSRRVGILGVEDHVLKYCDDMASAIGSADFLASSVEFPHLRSIQTNLYLNFISACWSLSSPSGVIGLIHPDGHFSDPKARWFRELAYKRLVMHAQFTNKFKLFEDVSSSREFSINIYAGESDVNFRNICSLFHPSTLDQSLIHDGSGMTPGLQTLDGKWNTAPHRDRVTTITRTTLGEWSNLTEELGTPVLQSRLQRPFTEGHLQILGKLSSFPTRISDIGFEWWSGWHETKAKNDRLIKWDNGIYETKELVFQPSHIGSMWFGAKQPNPGCKNRYDWSELDLLEDQHEGRLWANYRVIVSREEEASLVPSWISNDGLRKPAIRFFRLAWGRMVDLTTQRSLEACIVPPGPTHVNTAHTAVIYSSGSGRVASTKNTVLMAGLWSSLPYDYLVKVSGKADVTVDLINRFPAPIDHPAACFLMLRALKLACVGPEYQPLWDELIKCTDPRDQWTCGDFGLLGELGPVSTWTSSSTLRTEFERRAALVEIDALAALMLGLTADHLALMFRAQFPVLRKYEYEMYFDARGRKIAKDHHAQGIRQQKDDYKLLQAYLDGEDCGDLLDRYIPFSPDENHDKPWFYKPDRETEMRTAYGEFERRLGLNG